MKQLRFLPILFAMLLFTHCKEDDMTINQEVDIDEILTEDYSITMNPSGNNILTARIEVQTMKEVTVEARVLGEHPIDMPLIGPGNELTIDVFGLYAGSTNKLALRFEDNENRFAIDTVELITEELPDFLPEVEVLANNRSKAVLTLAGVSIGNQGVFETFPILIDKEGQIRWVLDLSFLNGLSFPIKTLNNGNLIFGRGDQVYEYNWMGEKVNEWNFPGYFQHHEVLETSNGTLIIAVDKLGLPTIEDHIIEIDMNSGAQLREWDLRQVLDMDRFDLIENEQDWFHMNAIYYVEDEDALIISGRNQGVVKVDGENKLEWILAPHQGWGKAGPNGEGFETSDFLLEAVDENGDPYNQDIQQGVEESSDFNWVWGQHAPMLLENGNLLVFDNGLNRNFTGNNQYSRGVEYKIDEENMTVQQEWQFGKERGEHFFSAIISDVDVNTAGNRVITAGIIDMGGSNPHSRIVEVNVNKDVIYELQLNFKNALSDGSGGWGQFDICYRSEQVDL